MVSPRPYFVFTPLLNDSTVGTLEFRNVLESVRSRKHHFGYVQGWADDIDFADKHVMVEPNVLDQNVGYALTEARQNEGEKQDLSLMKWNLSTSATAQPGGTGVKQVPTFSVKYDKLVIAVGCYSQTFNIPGVKENALFLKDINDARRVRRRILDLFELAQLPFIPESTIKHLLHFAVVGGGPTGMEFAACLSDLVKDDLARLYPQLLKYVRISLYDVAPRVLPMFDEALANYATQHYHRRNVDIKTGQKVIQLRKGFPNDEAAKADQASQVKHRVYTLETEQDGDIGIGMCLWSTGNMSNPFVSKASNHLHRLTADSAELLSTGQNDLSERQWAIKQDPKTGLMLVDDHLRLRLDSKAQGKEQPEAEAVLNDVFAIGDTAVPESGRLPGTAQVANQEALWLGKLLNRHPSPDALRSQPGFKFNNMGVFTYLGGSKAMLQGPDRGGNGRPSRFKGWAAFYVWRGAYYSMVLSARNRFLIAVQWLAVKVFGRDINRF